MPRLRPLVAVHLFLLQDNKILLSKRYNTGYEDGNWNVPAGHVEEGESVPQNFFTLSFVGID